MSVSPPRPKGPPLNALRAFEAAARLGSFVSAAEELSVTPGAVSQHIKSLEHWAKTPLFARHPKGVRLTQAGHALLPQFVLAFDHLGSAIRALQNSRPQTDIHVATMPSLAQLWLPPRLAAIRLMMPDVILSVTALETAPNLNRELFDVALFLREPSEAASETIIAEDRIFPVCSAEFAAGLKSLDDLRNVPLILDQSWQDDWNIWARQAGVDLGSTHEGPSYSLYSLALEEAKSGAGILIGHECLVEATLRAGDLIRPFPQTAVTGKSLIVEFPENAANQETAAGLLALLSE